MKVVVGRGSQRKIKQVLKEYAKKQNKKMPDHFRNLEIINGFIFFLKYLDLIAKLLIG
jgi:hypothetical protein